MEEIMIGPCEVKVAIVDRIKMKLLKSESK
jgi:hypothetical protein